MHIGTCMYVVPHAMLCFLFALFRVGHTALRQSQERVFQQPWLVPCGQQIPGEQNATFCRVSKALGILTGLMAT